MDGSLGELSETSDNATVKQVATGTSRGQSSLLEWALDLWSPWLYIGDLLRGDWP